MTRVMQDSINTAAFTEGADIYAGYVLSDTGEGHDNYATMAARFPDKMHLSICTRFNASAQCLDFENSTTGTTPADAQQAVNWTVRMRQAGGTPWNYCNESTWPILRAAYTANAVAEPIWWIANTSTGPVMIPGAAAHQYTFNLPRNPYDTSVVADTIEGFDSHDPSGGGTPIPPSEEDLMAQLAGWIVGDNDGTQWLVDADLRSGKIALLAEDEARLLTAVDFNGLKVYGTGLGLSQDMLNRIPTTGAATGSGA